MLFTWCGTVLLILFTVSERLGSQLREEPT